MSKNHWSTVYVLTHQKLHSSDEIVVNRAVLVGAQYTAFSLCLCAFFKYSQGTSVKSPSHKAPWYPALRHSHTVSSLLSLGLIPPPSDHLALLHCIGKCSYSLSSNSCLRARGRATGDLWERKLKRIWKEGLMVGQGMNRASTWCRKEKGGWKEWWDLDWRWSWIQRE